MEGLRHLALAVLVTALLGCGQKEIMSSDVKPKDPYAGMTAPQKIEAIRSDAHITGPLKAQLISDAQKEAGLPVTGQ